MNVLSFNLHGLGFCFAFAVPAAELGYVLAFIGAPVVGFILGILGLIAM